MVLLIKIEFDIYIKKRIEKDNNKYMNKEKNVKNIYNNLILKYKKPYIFIHNVEFI